MYKPNVYFQTLAVCTSKYRFIANEKVITHRSIAKVGCCRDDIGYT